VVVIPIPFWRCEKCRREHDSLEKAEACEAGHLIPTSVGVKSYTVRPYPYSLEVLFSDGKTRIYNAEDLGG
jgi:hypothetical protein